MILRRDTEKGITVTISDVYAVVQRQTQALKDIINAAGNGEPYSPEELERVFGKEYNAGYALLTSLGLPEGDGNPTEFSDRQPPQADEARLHKAACLACGQVGRHHAGCDGGRTRIGNTPPDDDEEDDPDTPEPPKTAKEEKKVLSESDQLAHGEIPPGYATKHYPNGFY